jgi:four helix bundle protein
MPSYPFAQSFTDLIVYQRARALAKDVNAVTRALPRDEILSLGDQWRRAARSVGAQIAEAWAKRRFPRHFASKLTDADAENFEVQHWTLIAFDAGHISREQAASFGTHSKEIGRMLGAMIQNAAAFSGEMHSAVLREEPTIAYFDPASDTLNTEH